MKNKSPDIPPSTGKRIPLYLLPACKKLRKDGPPQQTKLKKKAVSPEKTASEKGNGTRRFFTRKRIVILLVVAIVLYFLFANFNSLKESLRVLF